MNGVTDDVEWLVVPAAGQLGERRKIFQRPAEPWCSVPHQDALNYASLKTLKRHTLDLA